MNSTRARVIERYRVYRLYDPTERRVYYEVSDLDEIRTYSMHFGYGAEEAARATAAAMNEGAE